MVLHYPFAAVVGMERAKRSLLLHAVDPRIGGTLLLGHRGCAKSTLARGFAALLPGSDGQESPFVNVPLGVTEDRLLGSVQAERLLRTGEWTPQVGLLERAHGGVLYLDEVNLLPDTLSDLLLDSAASGVHHLERDGISQTLHARYILVGTMNPEEGELRPQLSDRFAHGVSVEDDFSVEERVEIGRRRMAFDDAPEAFLGRWAAETEALREQLSRARLLLLDVEIPEPLRLLLAERARLAAAEGLRAELAVLRSARAAAAFRGEGMVTQDDIEEAWTLCMGHRPSPSTPSPPPSAPKSPPAPKSPSSGSDLAPGSSHAAAASALTPKDSLPNSIPLTSMLKPRVLSIPEPLFKNRSLTAALSKATAHLSSAVPSQSGSLRWQASLIASLKSGWKPGKTGWQWMRSKPQQKSRFWALIDASRSTGAAQFLATARDALAGLLRAPMRIHLLLIQEGRVRWLLRNGAPQTALARLETLKVACGKSPLAAALQTLRRSIKVSGPGARDMACVCSDGMPTLNTGQTANGAAQEVRLALRRLAQTVPSPVLWLSPKASRAFSGWLDGLVRGTGTVCVGLER